MFLSAAGAKNGHKRKWKKSEIQAVERHLLYFINQYKVPQKYDCIVCLEAEPEALRNRSWKGVKDYVRNRITALKNANRCRSDDSEGPQQQSQRWGGSTESEAAQSLHPFDQIQYRFHTTRRLAVKLPLVLCLTCLLDESVVLSISNARSKIKKFKTYRLFC